VGKHGRAVSFDVLVQPNARGGLSQHAGERCLPHRQRIAAQIVAVQLNQVEGIEEYAAVSAVVTDEIERGNAFVVAGDSFAIDDAGS
jgi:hypothetical protein